ncbi:hypothetical protein AKJ16_DCAP19837 [Drosera capensis]
MEERGGRRPSQVDRRSERWPPTAEQKRKVVSHHQSRTQHHRHFHRHHHHTVHFSLSLEFEIDFGSIGCGGYGDDGGCGEENDACVVLSREEDL